jgi:hypothetical protein
MRGRQRSEAREGCRKTIAAIALCGMLIAMGRVTTIAQDVAKPQEPEYANSFSFLDSAGTLKSLEREPVGVSSRVKALGFGGADATYLIQNEHSPVRFAAGAPIEIVVKLEHKDVDPATVVLLYPLKVAKGKRQLLITGVGFMALHNKSDLQSKQIQMTFSKYGEASLKIVPSAPLVPGEYAIAAQAKDQQLTAYCFGVDASN